MRPALAASVRVSDSVQTPRPSPRYRAASPMPLRGTQVMTCGSRDEVEELIRHAVADVEAFEHTRRLLDLP